MDEEILRKMSTEELNQVLNDELEKSCVDGALVGSILNLLWEREPDVPREIPPEVEKACASWKIGHLYKRTGGRHPNPENVLRIAAVTVAACLLLTIAPGRAEAKTWWQKISRWTNAAFEFILPDDTPHTSYEFHTDNEGLQKLHDAVTSLGVTAPVVPMWLPEGYELVGLEQTSTDSKIGIFACFENEENKLVYRLDSYFTETWHEYHKDDNDVTVYEISGRMYNVMRNLDKWVVVWTRDNIEAFLSVECSEEELYRIIDSIYE